MNGGCSDALPDTFGPSTRPWYRCELPPALVLALFGASRDYKPLPDVETIIGPIAGHFDPNAKRTTYYAVYWRSRARWALVDLRARPRVVLTDNGARRRLFQRFDTVLEYIERLEREGL